MVIGYAIHGTDTFDKLLGDDLEYGPPDPCLRYKSLFDIGFLPDNYKIPKKQRDFFTTADGFLLVSEKVKKFCEEEQYSVDFQQLDQSHFFWLKPQKVIEFDHKTRGVLFSKFNPECNGYGSIYGGYPVCLTNATPLNDDFFRTDLSFGSVAKNPIVCTGINTKNKIKAAGLSGVYFEEIKDKYDKIPPVK